MKQNLEANRYHVYREVKGQVMDEWLPESRHWYHRWAQKRISRRLPLRRPKEKEQNRIIQKKSRYHNGREHAIYVNSYVDSSKRGVDFQS